MSHLRRSVQYCSKLLLQEDLLRGESMTVEGLTIVVYECFVLVCVYVCVCVFIKLHINAQSVPIILVILCHSH